MGLNAVTISIVILKKTEAIYYYQKYLHFQKIELCENVIISLSNLILLGRKGIKFIFL